MTERDFDKIFQDKIGDELPFEFQPADWLAAEQELDKVMPISAPVAPVMRLLTWHKWAAAAAVLLSNCLRNLRGLEFRRITEFTDDFDDGLRSGFRRHARCRKKIHAFFLVQPAHHDLEVRVGISPDECGDSRRERR